MKIKQRFIKSVVATASNDETVLPWARGTRRAAFVAKRKAIEAPRKSA